MQPAAGRGSRCEVCSPRSVCVPDFRKDAMNDTEFLCVWNGGPLLPPREGGSSLTGITQPRAPRATNNHDRPREHKGGFPPKYSEDIKAAVRALWMDGYKLHEISERMEMSIGTVWVVVNKGNNYLDSCRQ